MKKIVLILLVTITVNGFSQDLTSKNGEPILPQAKDWAIGIDATQLIKNANFNFVSSSQAITGKYFKDAHTAYRIGVRIGINNWITKAFVVDRAAATASIIAYPAAVARKENIWSKTATAIGLNFGIEKRRGSTRLQGIYGGEIGLYISSSKDKFTYGNKLNTSSSPQIVVDPSADAMSSPIFGAARNIDTLGLIQGVKGSARIVERKNGLALTIGVRVFMGAEYFVLPKMSIGGEFGWGLSASTTGRSETKLESMGQSNVSGSTGVSINNTTIDGGTTNHFGLDTDNTNLLGGLSASLRINLYF
ncbi:hypothetical protein [Aurantibacillus circumpalustris]|uniref:hypothetical protein n=1 Tax=Aurantibacillus circumpalustris TaxID=3036359 RepID=UPI00295BBBFA|nr:hypothetical protein [Aurantibacillus circumpalustris]